jgi:hypothetical protein
LPDSGWPFWWRWVVATNLGWFPGVLLGIRISSLVPETSPVLQAAVSAAVASAFFGAAQAWVLRGFVASPAAWWWATVLGWSAGVAVARLLLDAASVHGPGLADVVAVALVAGGVVGFAQAALLSRRCARWFWWPAISALGWGVLFPGALPGAGLVWLARGRPRSAARASKVP